MGVFVGDGAAHGTPAELGVAEVGMAAGPYDRAAERGLTGSPTSRLHCQLQTVLLRS